MPTLTMRCGASSSPTVVGFCVANTRMLSKRVNKSIMRTYCKIRSSGFKRGRDNWLTRIATQSKPQSNFSFYLPLVFIFCFLLPTVIPNWFWGESYWNAYFVCALFRYAWTLNMTWLVNSAAHFWGRKPYAFSRQTMNRLTTLSFPTVMIVT